MNACRLNCHQPVGAMMMMVVVFGTMCGGCGSSDDETSPASTAQEPATPAATPTAEAVPDKSPTVNGDQPPSTVEPPLDAEPPADDPPAAENGDEPDEPAMDEDAPAMDETATGVNEADQEDRPTPQQLKPLPAPEGAKRVSTEHQVWFDPQRKQVIVDGTVCLRRGVLELLACQSKTHEAVIQLNAPPSVVHAMLLLAGAETGAPAVFHPEYRPPTGSEIVVKASWVDKHGDLREVDARQFVRNVKTREALQQTWVFSGSRFEKVGDSGEEVYLADNYDDFICISNFPTAMMDLPMESSDKAEYLLFEAFSENIPPTGTHVRLTLIPQAGEAKDEG
jgi:hypothetical protein